MIKSIRFENFFSFKNVTIDLHQNINVLVGINGCGKSNLLKAIRLLKEGIAGNLKKLIIDEWGGFDQMCFADGKNNNIVLEYRIRGELFYDSDINTDQLYGGAPTEEIPFPKGYDVYYKITFKRHSLAEYDVEEEMTAQQQSTNNPLSLGIFAPTVLKDASAYLRRADELSFPKFSLTWNSFLHLFHASVDAAQMYDYFDIRPESKMRGPVRSPLETVLLSDGANLPQLLHTFQINNKQRYEQIIQALAHVNPWYKNINFEFYASGTMALMLEEKTLNRAVAAAHVSDGTLRFLCLLAIVCNPNRGSIVCIDEPETGLHPDMLRTISELLKEASHTTQFIIATHSETMLNMFDFEHLRVLEKNENNETIAKQFSEKDFEGWYEEFSLGTMWRNGDFGGNRW